MLPPDIDKQENVDSNAQKTSNEPPLKYKILTGIDLFKFEPVPKTSIVSSKRSLYGSILLILLFSTYMILTFVQFITNNTPMVNQYFQMFEQTNTSTPAIAFAYFFGDPFDETINNASIFTFQYQQFVRYQKVGITESMANIPLINCMPDWLPANNFTLLCPSSPGEMTGALYETPEFSYPRILVNYCKPPTQCISTQQLFQITAGGRIILYVQDQGPDFDMTTGKPIETIPYQTFQYFMMPGFYPRAEIYFQHQTYTILPDFFRRFQKEVRKYLAIESSVTWLTNVSIYNQYAAYTIYFRLKQSELKSYMKYITFMDLISLWGGFFGVLVSGFAAYFLVYNQNNFYQENKDWEDFGNKLKVKRIKDTIYWEENSESEKTDSIVFDSPATNSARDGQQDK